VQTRLFHTQNSSTSADWPKGDSSRPGRGCNKWLLGILSTPPTQRGGSNLEAISDYVARDNRHIGVQID
jgi:hypothetical protein